MRESYRSKRSRQARFQAEKENQIQDRRKGDDRREFVERRMQERRSGDRRNFDRGEPDRRQGDRRKVDRRQGERRAQELEQNEYEDIVAGRNAVIELLNSDRDINKIFIANGERHGSITKIIAMAKENKIVTVEVEKSKLDLMAENHQGVVAVVPPFNYCEIEDILDLAKQRGEDPFVLILDGIEDPHNLGSIIRTAETAGVHGVIIPKRRSVTVNSTVSKVSAGAVEHMKVARVNNINETIKKLKEAGLWVIGTDGDAKTVYYNQDLKGPLAIIIGSEGFGMSKLVKENADILIKIPMKGKITSLNASVSAGIVIYEAVKQRI